MKKYIQLLVRRAFHRQITCQCLVISLGDHGWIAGLIQVRYAIPEDSHQHTFHSNDTKVSVRTLTVKFSLRIFRNSEGM